MAYLHRITHTNSNIARKVNFFADYFVFESSLIGHSEYISLENPLSLVEKIIFQLENNLNKSKPYIDQYIKDPLFIKTEYFNEFSNYSSVQNDIQEYQKSNDHKWLINNKETFLTHLTKLKDDLIRLMIDKSMKAIISFLRCDHQLKEHIEDLKFHTHILVTAFYFTGRTRDELRTIFDKIITRDIKKFPFPEDIKNTSSKKKFLRKRTFDQQFEGILYLLNKKHHENIFYFRINGLLTEEDFKFKYNKVTFLNSNHLELQKAKTLTEKEPFTKDFFEAGNFLIAKVKVEFHSIELGKQQALSLINEEIKFLQITTKVNVAVDVFNYLITNNNKHFGSAWNSSSKRPISTESTIKTLKDNPFVFLAKYKNKCVDSILQHEYLYIKAINSGLISDYWQYIEVLIPKKEDDKKKVKDVISHALLLNAKSASERRLKHYLAMSINPFSYSASELGITKEKQNEYFQKRKFSLHEFKKTVKNDFTQDAIESWNKQYDLFFLQGYYYSILTEAYAIRNSFIHSGITNEKSVLKIHYALPNLIMRFRWILFDHIKKEQYQSIEDLMTVIESEGRSLLESFKGKNVK